jgi:hypothetical protein
VLVVVSAIAVTGSAVVSGRQLRSVTGQAIAGADIRTNADVTIRPAMASRIAYHPRTEGRRLRTI